MASRETETEVETLAALIKQQNGMAKDLASQDQVIVSLSNRMSGVENSVSSLANTVQTGFSKITEQLARQEGAKPPPLGSIMGLVALGGSIVSMMSAAITFLVLAIVSPDLTKLKERSEQHHSSLERIDREWRDDYRDLKKAEQGRLYERIDRLNFAPALAPGK